MIGLGGVGLVTAVVGNQILKPKISEPIKASRTCKFEVLRNVN
ncbi:hypothetical protein [Aphanizomenon flos-aquae]